MKCPHCQVEIHAAFAETPIAGGASVGAEPNALPGYSGGGTIMSPVYFKVDHMRCPACQRPMLLLYRQADRQDRMHPVGWIYPRRSTRPPAPP